MSDPAAESSRKKVQLSKEEIDLLLEKYDKDRSGNLSDEEIESIVRDFNSKDKSNMDKRLIAIIGKYDFDSNGTLDDEDVKEFKHEFKSTGTAQRVAGYSAVMARAFRYLAFTSDFGEALRPVISARLVNASYAVAGGYCVADVAWEAYKLKKRNYKTESGHAMSMPQLIVERSTFQALASIAIPFGVIHTTVDVFTRITKKAGKFQKWGPSIAGLCIIPVLPLYLDEPVEHGVDWFFTRYGPWAKSGTIKEKSS